MSDMEQQRRQDPDGWERAMGLDPVDVQEPRDVGPRPVLDDPLFAGAEPSAAGLEREAPQGRPAASGPAPTGPGQPAPGATGVPTAAASRGGTLAAPPQQTRAGTVIQRTLEDGSVQTITVGNDGSMARTTVRVNPSTGAEVTDSHAADGMRVHTTRLPGGDSIEVTTHPDGTTERTQIFRNSDGTVTTNHTARDGWVTSTRQGEDPDGTLWEEKTLPPDNRLERRTSKETRSADGSVVVETTGPDGTGRDVTSADGHQRESVFTFVNGRQETSRMVTNEDGSTVITNTHPDGSREVIRRETLPNGTVRETMSPSDFRSTEIILTTTLKNADGSTTIDVDGPDSTQRATTWPTGATETTVTYNDGSSERMASGFHPDGSKWHITENRDGSWERVEQPVSGTGAVVSRSDGTVIEQSFGDRINISILKPDGARERTDVDLDGAGTTRVLDASGNPVSETVHEGDPVKPFDDLGGPPDVPILSDAAVSDLDERGVVGRPVSGGGDADVVGDVVGDVAPEPGTPRLVEELAAPAAPAADSSAADHPTERVGSRVIETEPEPVVAAPAEPVAARTWDEPSYASEPDPAPEPEPSYGDGNVDT